MWLKARGQTTLYCLLCLSKWAQLSGPKGEVRPRYTVYSACLSVRSFLVKNESSATLRVPLQVQERWLLQTVWVVLGLETMLCVSMRQVHIEGAWKVCLCVSVCVCVCVRACVRACVLSLYILKLGVYSSPLDAPVPFI